LITKIKPSLLSRRNFEQDDNDFRERAIDFIELAKDFKTKYLQASPENRANLNKLIYRTVCFSNKGQVARRV